MLKKITDKTVSILRSVRKRLNERREERILRGWQNAENFIKDTPYNRGILCLTAGEFKKAVKLFKKAVEMDPEGSLKWYVLGEAYWEMGKTEEARASYLKAWSYRGKMKGRYEAWEQIGGDIREALVRSGAVREERDADSL